MILEVDSALKSLIHREAQGTRDVEVVFDAPTKEWAGGRNAPTVDIYLYDIREDLRRRERGWINEYGTGEATNERTSRPAIVARRLPPRHFKLSYLITAWTQRPEDEHRLLSALLECFLRFETIPANLLAGPLAELQLPVAVTIGLPPPEDRSFADVWSALGGELKPSLDLVVSAPIDTGQRYLAGPPVQEPPKVSFERPYDWPPGEDGSEPPTNGADHKDRATAGENDGSGKSRVSGQRQPSGQGRDSGEEPGRRTTMRRQRPKRAT